MRLMTAFFATTPALLALTPQTFGQGKRVAGPVASQLPKVIKFEGKGLQPALQSGAVTIQRPKAPPPQPLDPALLAGLYKSMGLIGVPQNNDYLLLTARQPYVAGKGELLARDGDFTALQNFMDFMDRPNPSVAFDIKPASVGQTYLIDITIDVINSASGMPPFHLRTPDNKELLSTSPIRGPNTCCSPLRRRTPNRNTLCCTRREANGPSIPAR